MMKNEYYMNCGSYLAGKGFKIGRKYVQIFSAHSGKCLSRCRLTDEVKSKLAEVKSNHPYEDDAIRVYLVDEIVDEANGVLQ